MWGILYIYITNKNKLIYKHTLLDNDIYIGDKNCYDHKLIYKAKITEKGTLRPLFNRIDYFRDRGSK